jgi:hypothetical protein
MRLKRVGPSDPQEILQLHHWEHPDWLYLPIWYGNCTAATGRPYRAWCEHITGAGSQPSRTYMPGGVWESPPRTWTVLHAPVREAVTVHQGSDKQTPKQLLSPGHKTVKWPTTSPTDYPHWLYAHPQWCGVIVWIQNGLKKHNNSPIYTQYLIMTKWKPVFRNCCTFIENEIQKYLIYISIHTPESILCRSTFGSDNSCESFWVSL